MPEDTLNSIDHSTTSTSEIPSGKSYLFAIGIDEYVNFNKLYNGVKDAKDIVQLLTSRYQFENSEVSILLNEQATRQNIYRQLDEYARTITPQDILLIYYSGHGTYIKELEEGFWIPSEAKKDDTSSYISNSDIIKRISAVKAIHIVVISDSCFSGYLFGQRSIASPFDTLAKLESFQSRWLFTSGRNTAVSDGQPGKNSPFAFNLLYHLKKNRERRFPLTEVSRLVINGVGNNNQQLPRCEPMRDAKHLGGEFMFRLKGVMQDGFADSSDDEIVDKPARPSLVNKKKLSTLIAASVVIIALFILLSTQKHENVASSVGLNKPDSSYLNNKGLKLRNNDSGSGPGIKSEIPKNIEDRRHKTKEGKQGYKTGVIRKIKLPKNAAKEKTADTKNTVEAGINESEQFPIKMCKGICDTKGIVGVEVSFIDPRTKIIYKETSNGSELIFNIPCELMKQPIRVTFRGAGQTKTRNVNLDEFEIPEM